MLRFVLCLCICFINNLSFAHPTHYIKKDFDDSMCIQDRAIYDLMLRSKYSKEYLDFYRKIFNENFPSNLSASAEPRIPKIMHRLWMGKKMPELYEKYDANCKKLHPDWKHVLWTEKEVEELIKDDELYKKYKARGMIAAQKDIALHEVLYKYGGVFMDTDFDCLQNFDELHHKYDFYASLEPGVSWSRIPVQTIAIVGSKPGNEVFKKSKHKADKFYEGLQSVEDTKYSVIRRLRLFFYYLSASDGRGILSKIRTSLDGMKVKDKEIYEYCTQITNNFLCKGGDARFVMMHSLASAFKEQYQDGERAIVFPATYFNPVFPRSFNNYSILDRLLIVHLKVKKDNFCYKSVHPETIAIQDFND